MLRRRDFLLSAAIVAGVGGLGGSVPAALAASAFDTPQCVSVLEPTIGMVGVMPPGTLDRNETTMFAVGQLPAVGIGDLVRVEPARDGGALTPTFTLLGKKAPRCAEIARASEAETAHHAGHTGHVDHAGHAGHEGHAAPAAPGGSAPADARGTAPTPAR